MPILTLIANRAATTLTPALINAVREVTRAETVEVLSDGEAADLAFAAPPYMASVRAALGGAAVDAIVTEAAGRRKRLLIADMDSTIVTGETLDELAEFAGLGEPIAAITRRSMNGEIDFASALRERVAMLKGLELSALDRTWEGVRLTEGATELVRTMRANGAVTALVSGGFTWFTGRVAALAGFTHHRANVLLDDGARLTGEVSAPILDRDAKLATLRELCASAGIGLDAALAVGDGANDLAMLQAAGLGVAFHAKPVVARAVAAQVNHTGLRALLFAQGYTAKEIVTGTRD
jgi:phosphoserine phosphatase